MWEEAESTRTVPSGEGSGKVLVMYYQYWMGGNDEEAARLLSRAH